MEQDMKRTWAGHEAGHLKSVTTPPSPAVIPANAGIQISQGFLDPAPGSGPGQAPAGVTTVGNTAICASRY